DAPSDTWALPANSTRSPGLPLVGGMCFFTSAGGPTPPLTAVGQLSAPCVALYSDTLPEPTGTPSASHAAVIPSIVRVSCHAPFGRSGLPMLRQAVMATAVAPMHTTLRASPATAAAAP